MRRALVTLLVIVSVAGFADAQSASARAWQQRLQLEIPLPVPLVALEAVNPFAVEIDEPPTLLQSTLPRKVDVAGTAVVAAYVDAKGESLGGVPLSLPFPGLTAPLVQGLTGARFDAAAAGPAPQASWVLLEINLEGRVKEASVLDPALEAPDPAAPPTPTQPSEMAPPGALRNLPFTPQAQLSRTAAPRRLSISAPARDDEIPVRALVHFTADGRCDRYVPLDLPAGLNPWLSAYLASWRVQPATRDGAAVDSWSLYSARLVLKLSGLDSTEVRVVRDREYRPDAT